jgi:sterol desaturase/sphingolipid hydroxylase (fatty acid hydroxylase superfamily)
MFVWIIIHLATFFSAALLTEIIGFLFHKLAHMPITGLLYRSHMTHHVKHYPGSQYFSNEYIDPGKDSFVFHFAPLFCSWVLLQWAVLPWTLWVTALVATSITAFLNAYLHDSYHIRNHWLDKYASYRKMRGLHYIHHIQMNRNLGITWPGIDKIFGTLRTRPPGVERLDIKQD